MIDSVTPPGRPRRAVALAMALLVAFLGIAVFTSLHTHQGPNKRCSLNGFDSLMTGEAEPALVVHASSALAWTEAPPNPGAPVFMAASFRFLRGPPAAL